MIAKFDPDEFMERLRTTANLTEKQAADVMLVLCEGLDVELTDIHQFDLEMAGGIKICVYNNHGTLEETDEPLRSCNFDCRIPGIDTRNIKALTLPKLDCTSSEALTLGVTIVPFKPPEWLVVKDDGLGLKFDLDALKKSNAAKAVEAE
jgi:hypothetical protein